MENSRYTRKPSTTELLAILIDDITEDGVALARSAADAPEIDGLVIIEDGANLEVGEFIEVTVTESTEHDLIGKRLKD